MTRHSKEATALRFILMAAAIASLSACATPLPLAPSFVALPKAGESFADFQRNDASCRTYAGTQSGQPTADMRTNHQVGSALTGAALGASAGAILGSVNGHAGNGAAIGAGSGLLLGSAFGAQNDRRTQMVVQRRYDGAYAQCMTAAGERVPERPRPVIVRPAPVIMAPPPVIVAPAPVYAVPPPWER
jgi:outer membrane lipoprotein SlyB